MISGKYWPAHPHPLPGESLSCWIVRTAHANGLKVQTFCDREFGKDFQIWNRDIDRNAPEWLLAIMSDKTGTPIKQVRNTTARLYEKRLFPKLHSASQLRWFMALKKKHRTHKGYAQQYCPLCLKEDDEPYFRLQWRLALYTFCTKHRILMADRCYHCGGEVEFHRLELGKANQVKVETLDCCWICNKPLSSAPIQNVNLYPKLVDQRWSNLLESIDRQLYPAGALRYQNITLLHQFCRLLSSGRYRPRLSKHICTSGHYSQPELKIDSVIFEQRDIIERHTLLQLAWWIMTNRNRIKTAIHRKAVRVNLLYRDLDPDTKRYVIGLLTH
ncbi:MAG: hypothetical protein CMI09_14680 [Oceanospirillaceae bacterium]|nr:hypothetical protein [Oceanospirillaceae bacterium]MBM97080.1 hypothetical protein [Oceanospirillaceae bacterium]